MEYKARYEKRGLNPFDCIGPKCLSPEDAVCVIRANFPDDTSVDIIKEMAIKATPESYEFIEIKEIYQ